MQNLSITAVLENISQGRYFEANCEGGFIIKIQEYVPYVCTAIHDGHKLRTELQEICLLTAEERLYEEDPFTADFIQSLPITLIGLDSRYEYDLNRDEENCIYEEAWGKQVWNRSLTDQEKQVSLIKHKAFYKVVFALISKLEKDFGSAIIYDIHSFNYKRHKTSFLFNIGIENIDIKKYNSQISYWKKQLLTIKTRKITPEVSVNHIFYGRGYLLKFVKDNFDNTLVLATELQKVFMNELDGTPFPLVIQTLSKGLKNAIINNSQHYINSFSNFNVKRKSSLLTGDIQPELLKLDKKLYRLVKNFEILGHVNPSNIELEKRKFFNSKFANNPTFKYSPLTIDPHVFKSKMYQLDVDAIDDVHIRQIYIDIIGAYADKVDMLSTIGSDKFLYNSLRYFGEPSSKDIENANFLLYCNELPQFENERYLDSQYVKDTFSKEVSNYGFQFKVEEVSNIPSDAIVINSKKMMLLKKGAKFTSTRLKALVNHEIGVHMVTTMNAQAQPLNFLSIGLPRNTYTQEGLAIMSEMFSGSLTISRLKELALRVLAVESLTQGNDFKTTYQYLLEEFHPDPEKLFYLVTRVYRGGGFTKDFLYLRGFRKVLRLYAEGININNLFLGKTTHHYLPYLNELVDRGILNKPQYLCRAFETPEKTDPILKYLIDSMR
jgi:uncharacterized protein (TIGR02421 family)